MVFWVTYSSRNQCDLLMIYTAVVQSISNPDAPALQLGCDDNADLFIFNMVARGNYLDFSAPGEMVLVGFNRAMPSTGQVPPENVIKSGDLIKIYENRISIFVGYVTNAKFSWSSVTGEMMTITYDTNLSHFMRQNTIQTFSQVVNTLSPTPVSNTDFNPNQVTFKTLIDFLMSGSIYEYVARFYQFEVVYKNSGAIQPNLNVFYYASTQSTKEQVLNSTLFAYQTLCYQDQDGNMVFTLPSSQEVSLWNLNKGDQELVDYEVTDNAAAITNNVVSSLIYLGFFPPADVDQGKNLIAQSVPDQNFFPESYQLYNSGFFSQVQLEVDNLSTNVVTDPTLLNLLTNVQYIVPQNGDQRQGMAGLLSARYLAAALTQSKVVEINVNRNIANTELPLSKIIQLNGQKYICIGWELTLNASPNDMRGNSVSNRLKLIAAPLRSITGYWIA
jgi:hypothetical protein